MSAQNSDRYQPLLLATQPLYQLLNKTLGETQPDIPNPVALDPQLPDRHPFSQLCRCFQLTESERDLLLLCLLLALEPRLKFACSRLQTDADLVYPTYNLARILLKSYHPRVLTRQSPLNYWQLLTSTNTPILTEAPLKLDPIILAYILGENDLDPALADILQPVSSNSYLQLISQHQTCTQPLSQVSFATTLNADIPYLELTGSDLHHRRHVAAAHCQSQQRSLYTVPILALPATIEELNQWRKKWERHALLTGSILLLELSADILTEKVPRLIATHLLTTCRTPIISSLAEPMALGERPKYTVELPPLTAKDRETLWLDCLGDRTTALNGTIAQIADQFPLTPQQISTLVQQLPINSSRSAADLKNSLWQTCRQSARPHLQDFAQRVETRLSWDDLILPESLAQRLKSIVAAVRQRHQVYQDWGFARKQDRGLGIIALFAGESGTGKTTAAEIIAKELELDCYRVDLSNIVNKYIGETEKNLKRVFDAAEGSGAMLLFDEADAIFGMRGEVKEAKDRYANQEVSYLLQRLETFPGIAILTTNLKKSIDEAFLRRLRYVIDFPTPTEGDRRLMWQGVFPQDAPLENVNYQRLAKLNVTGSNIRNIALTAAFLAADTDKAITMEVVGKAVDVEYDKLGRQLSGPEFSALRGELSYPRL